MPSLNGEKYAWFEKSCTWETSRAEIKRDADLGWGKEWLFRAILNF